MRAIGSPRVTLTPYSKLYSSSPMCRVMLVSLYIFFITLNDSFGIPNFSKTLHMTVWFMVLQAFTRSKNRSQVFLPSTFLVLMSFFTVKVPLGTLFQVWTRFCSSMPYFFSIGCSLPLKMPPHILESMPSKHTPLHLFGFDISPLLGIQTKNTLRHSSVSAFPFF